MSKSKVETTYDDLITVELTGSYQDVVKLSDSESIAGELDTLNRDLVILLETLVRMNGGTRSAIADQLPKEMVIAYDAETVVDAMNLLAWYDLVRLDGNTWKPGTALEQSEVSL